MKRTLIISTLVALGFMANATEPLDSVFNHLRARKGITEVQVQYSGSFSDGCPGFMFKRGDGKGWTKGPRLKVTGVSQKEAGQHLMIKPVWDMLWTMMKIR